VSKTARKKQKKLGNLIFLSAFWNPLKRAGSLSGSVIQSTDPRIRIRIKVHESETLLINQQYRVLGNW